MYNMLNTCSISKISMTYKNKISTFFLMLYFSFQIQDSTFQFEKRRNVPVKYNRELWSKTGLFVIISLLFVVLFCQSFDLDSSVTWRLFPLTPQHPPTHVHAVNIIIIIIIIYLFLTGTMSSMVAVNIITTLDVCTFLFIVSAMKRIEEIKSKRQDQFIKNRLVQTIVCITGRLWWENQCYVVLLSFISECLTRSSGIKGQAPPTADII